MEISVMELSLFLVGILIGTFSLLAVEWYKVVNEKKALAALIAADIEALSFIITLRGHKQSFTELLEYLKSGQNPDLKGYNVVGDKKDYSTGIRGNLSRVGLLGPTISKEVMIYLTLFDGIMTDIINLGNGGFPLKEDKIRMVSEMLKIYDILVEVSDSLKTKLINISLTQTHHFICRNVEYIK